MPPFSLQTLAPCDHPLVGKQLGDSVLRMGADAFEDVAQVGKRIDAESFARGDEAGQDRRRPPAVVAPIEHPVFATNRDSTQAAFGTVVVDLQVAVLAVSR